MHIQSHKTRIEYGFNFIVVPFAGSLNRQRNIGTGRVKVSVVGSKFELIVLYIGAITALILAQKV